jgi:hypothetical protein
MAELKIKGFQTIPQMFLKTVDRLNGRSALQVVLEKYV